MANTLSIFGGATYGRFKAVTVPVYAREGET